MAKDKIIKGHIVRNYDGLWHIMETRCGQLTGKAYYHGSMKEIRKVINMTR